MKIKKIDLKSKIELEVDKKGEEENNKSKSKKIICFEVIAACVLAGMIIMNRITPAVSGITKMDIFMIMFYILTFASVIIWIKAYGYFKKNSGKTLVQCVSLHFIVCGIVASVCISLFGKILPLNADVIAVLLTILMFLISIFRFKGTHLRILMTFLTLPYVVFSSYFFIISGFISAFLFIIGIFTGTLIFENEKTEDSDYFGNSNRPHE